MREAQLVLEANQLPPRGSRFELHAPPSLLARSYKRRSTSIYMLHHQLFFSTRQKTL